jgi:4-hydroxy-tetrahydrodipicolinate synthase
MRMAEHALECGADMLMMYAPTLFRGLPDQDEHIVEHVRALAGLGAPLLLFYLYEAAGGISYTLDVLRQMFSLPEVVGIKMATLDSVMTYQDVAALVAEEFPDSVLITGEDRFVGYSLMWGATSALIGMASAVTAPQAALLDLYFSGRADEFLKLNRAVDEFSRVTFCRPMEGYIQRMLWCLADDGIIPEEAAFDPWAPAFPAAERQLVRRRARELYAAAEAVTAAPVATTE